MELYGEIRRELNTDRRLYICDWCGHLAPWDDSWSWYGSYKESEDDGVIVVMCDDECKAQVDRLTKGSTVTAANVLSKIATVRASPHSPTTPAVEEK